ncbi:MAG: M48 family metalloprotease, partial [Phycisphaerae bacterium]|nr:M48 family metalloprotease [Phycisphaerae bacterium]
MYGLILAGLIMSIVAIESLPRDAYVSPLFCIAGMAATAVAVVLIGLLIDLWIAVRSRSVDPGRLARSSRRLGRLYQILVLAVYGVEIFVLDWPGYVASAVPVTAGSMLLTEALVLAPFLVLVLASWAVFFPSDRRLRAISSRPALSLRHYMTLHTRQHMLIALGPLVVMLAIHDSAAAMFSTAGAGSATGVATVIALGGLILLSGLWIKTCWGAVSMPEGGLRSRLESLARRARLKVRDILLWPTYNTIVNGCVIGPVGTFRYILITDALLDALPAQEIEAVFSHEIGHIKHRHMHLYIFLAFGGLALAEPVMQLAEALTQ